MGTILGAHAVASLPQAGKKNLFIARQSAIMNALMKNRANLAYQQTFEIRPRGRGTTEITAEVARLVRASGIVTVIAQVFVRHTSCSVMITENADPAVHHDLETLAKRWVPDGDQAYRHDTEGGDDMAAHARSVLSGSSVTVPVGNGELLLGTWQGIYLWEHRTGSHPRRIVVTVIG